MVCMNFINSDVKNYILGLVCLRMPQQKDVRVAVTCSSNMNRSMEAHAFLKWVLPTHMYGEKTFKT